MTWVKPYVLVTGAGGFIGHHLVKYLKDQGCWVRGADIKNPEFEATAADDFRLTDLRDIEACHAAVRGVDEVYHLAANMGGIGFITAVRADVVRDNVTMDANMLEAAGQQRVRRFFYASSACVYPKSLQESPDVAPLREEQAIPAEPEDGYGWEKLLAEQMCRYALEEHGLQTRVARFHNVYGPLGTYEGGREKAPAALCRKIALARDGDEIEVWGDGLQTRSFLSVDECVEGIWRITQSDHDRPLNLGTDRMVTVRQLAEMIIGISGKKLSLRFDPSKPQGVRGRNSDNARLRQVLGWEPRVPLEEGLAKTYRWVLEQSRKAEQRIWDAKEWIA